MRFRMWPKTCCNSCLASVVQEGVWKWPHAPWLAGSMDLARVHGVIRLHLLANIV